MLCYKISLVLPGWYDEYFVRVIILQGRAKPNGNPGYSQAYDCSTLKRQDPAVRIHLALSCHKGI
jgi:hypothetical protein